MRRAIKRRSPSSVDRLEPELKRLIADLMEKGKSIDQIRDALVQLGANVSRTALGRHTRTLHEIGEELRHSREMARALIEKVEAGDDARIADLNYELAHTQMLRILTAQREGKAVQLSAEEVQLLARAMSAMAAARKADAERRRKDREDAKKELLAAVAAEAKKPGSGLTKATVDQIYHAVLGVQS